MPMNEIIREQRKALGLTQEQVADYLGVTAPAVNKWEKGATCPDIALLSPLARLLRVDPNTLLCFGEGPTGQEVARLCSEIGAAMRTGGFARGFDLAMTHLRTYPACAPLLHSAAMLLDGGLMMSGLSPEEREPYAARIITLYERAADCGDGEIRVSSTFLLASKHIASGQYDSAQALLDRLPERSAMDKRLLQANLWARQGKLAQAAEVPWPRSPGRRAGPATPTGLRKWPGRPWTSSASGPTPQPSRPSSSPWPGRTPQPPWPGSPSCWRPSSPPGTAAPPRCTATSRSGRVPGISAHSSSPPCSRTWSPIRAATFSARLLNFTRSSPATAPNAETHPAASSDCRVGFCFALLLP